VCMTAISKLTGTPSGWSVHDAIFRSESRFQWRGEACLGVVTLRLLLCVCWVCWGCSDWTATTVAES
jgi:hypothetical protein